MSRRSNIAGFTFLAPSLIGFLVFVVLPVLGALGLSLFRWDVFHRPRFVGLQNFWNLLGWSGSGAALELNDPRFWNYLGNTLFFMLAIPFSIAASLLLAIVLNQKLPGRAMFRTIFFVPSVCAGVGILLLWKFLNNPEFGLINRGLQVLGISGPMWLQSYHWAKPAIMIMNIWAAMGGTNMILYLAALQGVPGELYEAAQIDGAGAWRQFVSVTLPMLNPTTFFILTVSIIDGFQGEFDAAYVMTQGGPDGSTTTLSYYIYRHAFEWFNMGYAATIAVVLFAFELAVTLLKWRHLGSRAWND